MAGTLLARCCASACERGGCCEWYLPCVWDRPRRRWPDVCVLVCMRVCVCAFAHVCAGEDGRVCAGEVQLQKGFGVSLEA